MMQEDGSNNGSIKDAFASISTALSQATDGAVNIGKKDQCVFTNPWDPGANVYLMDMAMSLAFTRRHGASILMMLYVTCIYRINWCYS
jgi:hypothetical protein